jgi:thiamine-phosphate pyrophosphorylase
MESTEAARLILVTPAEPDAAFPARLEEALGDGDVAAVLVAGGAGREAEKTASELVPIIQAAGAAALIADDTRLAGHVKADGVQVSTGLDDLRLAMESFRPKRIVGAGGLASRHDAMQVGELDIDYVFFGRPHGDTRDTPHPRALELAEWWSELTQIPAAIMAGRTIESVAVAAATGAAFIAVGDAIWSHRAGPAEAVTLARAALQPGRRAA